MHNIVLWEPDIFHKTLNVFIESNDPSPIMVARELYGMNCSTIKQSCGFEANSKNYHIGDIILKRLIGNYDVLLKQLIIYQSLNSYGIYTPNIICNMSGQIISTYNSEYWVAMEYIDGNFYSGSMNEIELVVDIMKQLFCALHHQEIFGLPHRPKINSEYINNKDLSLFGETIHTILKESMYDITLISRNVCKAMELFDQSLSVVHIDLHPRNILYKKGKLYILDFDSIQVQSREIAYNFAVYKLLRRCVSDGIDFRPFINKIFHGMDIPKNSLAAQAEIIFRLTSILHSSSPGNISIWKQLIPVHLRGLYESEYILGDL